MTEGVCAGAYSEGLLCMVKALGGPQRGPHFNAVHKEEAHPPETPNSLPAEAETSGPAEIRKEQNGKVTRVPEISGISINEKGACLEIGNNSWGEPQRLQQ